MPNVTPAINLLVLKAPDIDRAARFYQLMGLTMERHQHGSGPWHYCTEVDGLVFEIYPGNEKNSGAVSTRLGFEVRNLDVTLSDLQQHDVKVVKAKSESPWGLRAVVEDFAGHRVELTQKQTLPQLVS